VYLCVIALNLKLYRPLKASKMKLLHLALPLLLPTGSLAKAILGVDLGSLYMKVALVQRGAPLEIVTNMHSKRKTEQMVLFDSGTRFYGADADALIGRKPKQTPQGMSVFLGRSDDHPTVKVSVISTALFFSHCLFSTIFLEKKYFVNWLGFC